MDSSRVEEALLNIFPLPGDLNDALTYNGDEFLQNLSSSDKTPTVNKVMLGDQSLRAVVPFYATKQGRRKSTSLSTNRPIKRTICNIAGCGRTVLQRTLDRHVRTVHKRGPDYSCDECDRRFPRKDSLDRHHEEQHGCRDDKIECTRCGMRVGRRALGAHSRSRKCQGMELQSHDAIRNPNKPQYDYSRNFIAIVQQAQEDFRLLHGLGIESVCNPLISSLHFFTRASSARQEQTREKRSKRTLTESKWRPELVQLRGLSIRTILRSFDGGEVGDELRAAIVLLHDADDCFYRHIDPHVDLVEEPYLYGMYLSLECLKKMVLMALNSYKPVTCRPAGVISFYFGKGYIGHRVSHSVALSIHS